MVFISINTKEGIPNKTEKVSVYEFNEIQMLERQIMFKQLQELQRQKNLLELNDAHKKNVTQYGLLNHGVPVRDASQMFMFGDTNPVHGLPNRFVYSQTQAPNPVHLVHFQAPVLSQSQTMKPQKVNNQGFDSLDPLEQKVLFNVEYNNTENVFEKTDNKSVFNYGVLMQSAVSEVSNGDSGSVLSFQNPDENYQNSNMVESGKHYNQTSWLYNNNNDYSGISGFMDRSFVKKEDGEKRSTLEVKPGIGKNQQVTSSRRQSNIWVDVPMQQNPPSTSYKANRKKMETGFGQGSGKMHPRGNHGHAVVKKEKVDYKSQPISSSARNLSVKAGVDRCLTNEVALGRSSSIYLKQYDVAKENMVVSKSRKRKVATFEVEVTEGCSRLHDMKIAEEEWAHSVNRIPEKVVDSHLIVDRKRRRLILTTQLMQLLFKPSPKINLSEDVTKHCDSIIYHVAKFGLNDACKSFRRIYDNNDLLTVVEGFIDRSKRLEEMLSRFEKGESSILDVKVEFQDLDKFSVVNRFAKFHSRGPLVTSDTSASMQELSPEKYVTASEMPSIKHEHDTGQTRTRHEFQFVTDVSNTNTTRISIRVYRDKSYSKTKLQKQSECGGLEEEIWKDNNFNKATNNKAINFNKATKS
ncbi:hypothetical protein LXL04_013418 [Taraxacum kok-saghyz]